MGVQQGTPAYSSGIESARPQSLGAVLLRAVSITTVGLMLFVSLQLLGAAQPSPRQEERARLVATTAGSTFSITRWMAGALVDKWEAAFVQPAAGMSIEAEVALVERYLTRAGDMRALQADIDALYAESGGGSREEARVLQQELERLRKIHRAEQSRVEQVIQRQVSEELARRGITVARRTFPPVQFMFSEPPKKFVVSPRNRIETRYYRMLEPEFSTAAAEAVEETIADEFDLSGYVTRIGGMGAFPTMVVESPALSWIFTTVAHEWVHNYLTLHPLGLSYSISPELTIINETVAEIVGDEVGEAVVRRYYQAYAPPDPEASDSDASGSLSPVPAPPPSGPMPFDFRTEMRRTRLVVDQLLADDRIELAEAYMEQQRLKMASRGYPLRKLNQAYFAFHGSYGTSAASTDPIGPRLFALREAAPDVLTFLRAVRGITSVDEMDVVLETFGIARP